MSAWIDSRVTSGVELSRKSWLSVPANDACSAFSAGAAAFIWAEPFTWFTITIAGANL